jgi:hypothetical protein
MNVCEDAFAQALGFSGWDAYIEACRTKIGMKEVRIALAHKAGKIP